MTQAEFRAYQEYPVRQGTTASERDMFGNIVRPGKPFPSCDSERKAYIKGYVQCEKDFIEKAVKWMIKDDRFDYLLGTNPEIIKDFREYMEDCGNPIHFDTIQEGFILAQTVLDTGPKNQFFLLKDEPKIEFVPLFYEKDTPIGGSNGLYNKAKFAWCLKHISEVTSHKAMSPRGWWFHYAALYDGHIYAIGEEQGNYAGGDIISVETKGEDAVRDYIDNYLANSNDEYDKSLYEKIKDLPVATKEMVDEMNVKLESFEKGETK